MGATLGQYGAPSRVTVINKTAAPTLQVGDSLLFQFVWRPTGGTFDPDAEPSNQNQLLQYGVLRNPSLTGGSYGNVGPVGSFGGTGYSFLGDGITDSLFIGATQVAKGQKDLSLLQGDATFLSALTMNFGIYNEQGTKLLDLGTHTLGIRARDGLYAVYSFNFALNFVSTTNVAVSVTLDQYLITTHPSIVYTDHYTGYTIDLGSGTVASGLGGLDNLYVGMGHTIANNNEVALSGSSYDSFTTQEFANVPEPGTAFLTFLSGTLWMCLRRRK